MIHNSALNLRRDYCFQWERVVAGDRAPGMESGGLTELKVKKAQQAPRDRDDVNGGLCPSLSLSPCGGSRVVAQCCAQGDKFIPDFAHQYI